MKLIKCRTCSARYAGQRVCGVCGVHTCPNCFGCDCTYVSERKKTPKKLSPIILATHNKPTYINVPEVNNSSITENLSIRGTISSLITQKDVYTHDAHKLLSEFNFHDDKHYHIRITFWGPLPKQIFKNRYKFNPILIHE